MNSVEGFTGSQARFPQQGKVIIRRVDLVVEPDTPRVKPAARGMMTTQPQRRGAPLHHDKSSVSP